MLSFTLMKRRQDRACEMIAVLPHPSPEVRLPLGDLRFLPSAASGITSRSASPPTAHNWKRPH